MMDEVMVKSWRDRERERLDCLVDVNSKLAACIVVDVLTAVLEDD